MWARLPYVTGLVFSVVVAAGCSGAARPTTTHPWPRPSWRSPDATLAQRLARNEFDYFTLSDSIPGFAGADIEASFDSCHVQVWLTDPQTQAARARIVLQPLLTLDPRCNTLRVEQARFTWAEMFYLQHAVASLVRSMALADRAQVAARGDTVVVEAYNQRALARLRQRITRDRSLRREPIVLRLRPGPQMVDGPIDPPAGAYLAVLDSAAVRLREIRAKRRVVVDTAGLPAGIGLAELRKRGFELKDSTYRCGVDAVLHFDAPVHFDDGRYRLTIIEYPIPEQSAMSNDHVYDVVCATGTCRIIDTLPGGGDRVTVCPLSPRP
jgi:hypothetical protein